MDEMTISIADVVAAVVRKGKNILIAVVAAALLLGAAKGFLEWRKLNNEEYLNIPQLTYEQELLKLENTIKHAQQNIANQEDYIANSLWMQINPYDKHVADVYLSISGVDERDVEMTFGQDITPLEYLMGKITAQYQILWSAMDLPSALDLPQYSNTEDKYVREIVGVDFLGSGIISVTAIGNSEEDALELANAVVSALMSNQALVIRNSYDHTIDVYNTVHQNRIDTGMAASQEAHYERVIQYNDTILSAEQSKRLLEEPDSILVAVIKMMILGGIAGGVLACGWYCGKLLLRGSLQSSAQMERSLSVPCLGSAAERGGLFGKMADFLSGERVWKSEEAALHYISESTRARMAGKQLLLASSLELEKHTKEIKKLKKALAAAGAELQCAGDFSHNPNALAALQQCDAVVLAEALDHTKLEQALKIRGTADEYNKPVIGFVLI